MAQLVRVAASHVPPGEPQGRARDGERGRYRAPRGGRRRAQRRPVQVTVAGTEKKDVFRGEAEAMERQKTRERTEPHEVRAAGASVEPGERRGTRAFEAEDEALRARTRRDERGEERVGKPHERRPASREIAARNRPLPERLRRHLPSSRRAGPCPVS